MAAFLTLQISMKASKEVSKCTNRCFMPSQLSVFCLDTKRELAHFETYSLPFNSVTKYLCRTEYRRVIFFPLWKYRTPRRREGLFFQPSPPPILLVGRKAKFSFKGAVSSNSEVLIFLKFSRYTNWKYTDATPRTDLEIGRKCKAFFAKGDH